MKRILMVVFLLLMLLMTACSSESTGAGEATSTNEATSSSETANTSGAAETSDTSNDESTEITFTNADQLKIVSTYDMKQSGVSQTMTSTYYIAGNNTKIEGEASGMTYSLIYNDDEKTTYMVNDADKTVLIMGSGEASGYDSFGSMLGDNMDEESYGSLDEIASIFGDYEITTYEGVPAIYVETSGDNMGDSDDGMLKLWISQDYGYPIHSELYSGGEVVMVMDATITDDFEMTDDFFMPPSDYSVLDMNNLYQMGTDSTSEGTNE